MSEVIATVPYKGHNYRVYKLDARKQFHLAARFKRCSGELSELSDEDRDWLWNACLPMLERETGNDRPWAKVATPTGELMFSDLNPLDVNALILEVTTQNLMGFSYLSALLTEQQQRAAASS